MGIEWKIPVVGFTHSAVPSILPEKDSISAMFGIAREKDSIFIGRWWSGIEEIEENVILFIIYFPAIAEERKLDESIILLKEKIFETYEMFESPQEEIWIVKQDIYRYA